MSLITCIFALFLTLIIPVAASVWVAARNKSAKAVLFCAACFIVFQLLLRIPAMQYILPMSADYVLFKASNPATHLVLLALSAGVFEECGRYM